MVCAVAVDLRLKHRIDKYVAWGLSIVGGWELHFEAFESGGPKNICFPIKDTVISSENELDDFNFGPPLWDSLKWFS